MVLPYKVLLLEGQDGKVWKNHEQIVHHVTFHVQMVKWIQPWQYSNKFAMHAMW
jgi:hypothetical protein